MRKNPYWFVSPSQLFVVILRLQKITQVMDWNLFLMIGGVIVGTTLLLWGADRFTDGACGIARKWHVSELIIGLTIVSMGTSLPEFVVSLFSSLRGSTDMSVGNILGSNAFNTLVIVGASCLMMKVVSDRGILFRDIPFCLLVSLVLAFLGMQGVISRWGALLLCFLFTIFMAYNLYLAKSNKAEFTADAEVMSMGRILFLIIIGIGTLVGGGQLLVNSATSLARSFGVSESIIGLTILAGGTSLPELATSVMAARKGSQGVALGNVIGSNVFNIAFVLGICSLVRPMQITDITLVDWSVMLGSVLLLWVFAYTGRRITKLEGSFLLLCYAAYLSFLLLH